jgi:hypothetical protein
MDLFNQGNKAIKETAGWFTSDRAKFGAGGSLTKERDNCEEIRLFVVKYDVLGFREAMRKRSLLDKNLTLRQAAEKHSFASNNDVITDENFYRFEHADYDEPLWKFSSNCNLNLSVIARDQLLHADIKHQLKPIIPS